MILFYFLLIIYNLIKVFYIEKYYKLQLFLVYDDNLFEGIVETKLSINSLEKLGKIFVSNGLQVEL
jgi:hypothetical protein